MHFMSKFQVLLFALMVLSFTSCRQLFYNHETYYSKSIESYPFDVIIVPGVTFENGTWCEDMKKRVLWSLYLYNKGIAKNVIYSGSSVRSPFVEGKIMALYAEALGIPKENIYVESRAEHSTENVYYGTILARKLGFCSIAVATDRYQTRTLISYIPTLRTSIKVLPIQDSLLVHYYGVAPEIDFMQAYVPTFVSLNERESLFTRVKGTLGMNIKIDRDSLR